ncbi:hypothetical protein RAA17_14285 [Komagataeibacter rhaeticus]|nr:hypothetical protein [Komagataeibacter rhaeticus]
MLMGMVEVVVGLLVLGWGCAACCAARPRSAPAPQAAPCGWSRARCPAGPCPRSGCRYGTRGDTPADAPVDAGFSVPVSMADYGWAVRLYQPHPC